MRKYRVFGHTTVVVTVVVEAENEEEAYEIALNELDGLSAYCGNGGIDKLIGVDGHDQTVSADDEIIYDDIELLDVSDYDDEGKQS